MLVAFRNIYTYPNFIQCHKKLCFTVGMSNVKSVPTIFSHQMPVREAAQKVGLSFSFFYHQCTIKGCGNLPVKHQAQKSISCMLSGFFLVFFSSDSRIYFNCGSNHSTDCHTTIPAIRQNSQEQKLKIDSTVAVWQKIRQIWAECYD
jgi:hypothetical protein